MKMLKRRSDAFYLTFSIVAILTLLACFGVLNISYQLRKSSTNVDTSSMPTCEESLGRKSKSNCSSLIMHHRKPKNFPLTFNSDEFVILILSSDRDEKRIIRFIKHVIKMAEESPIVLHLENSSLRRDEFVPLPVHLAPSLNSYNFIPYTSLGQRLFSNPLRKIFEDSYDQSLKECSILHYKSTINVFTPTRQTQNFLTYTFNKVDDEEQKLGSFGESPFQPYQSNDKPTRDGKEKDSLLNKGTSSEITEKCERVKAVKSTFEFIIKKFPNFKFLIIIDDRKHLTPNLISYFKEVSKAFTLESSLYCVSADNPLQREDSDPPEGELLAVDNFVFGGATLIPRGILVEILSSYKIPSKDTKENTNAKDSNNIMEEIGHWLSWWRVRKTRYCVIPARPRICKDGRRCSQALTTNFELQKLIRHRYFHKLFYDLEMVKPLLYENCPCQNNTKPLLNASNNETSYALYVKMISQDDNLMLNYAMKCFGIDHVVGVGNFDNVYKFYWGKDPVFIIGVPYSNFGPSIKLESTLYMLQVTPEFGESLAGILKAQNYDAESANLTAVPFEFKNEEKNSTEAATTAATTTTTATTITTLRTQ